MTLDDLKDEIARIEARGAVGSAEVWVGPYLATGLDAPKARSVNVLFQRSDGRP